jgi:hypothetical protein
MMSTLMEARLILRLVPYARPHTGAEPVSLTWSFQVMVKLELNLPWKPVLAWPWGVKYDIDPESYLVTSHVESWDIEPWEVRLSSIS